MFNIIPIIIIDTIKDVPPYDINGRVTPVTGTNPITTNRFNIVWNISEKDSPNERYFPNKSFVFSDIFIDL